jgi:hypothetical protein
LSIEVSGYVIISEFFSIESSQHSRIVASVAQGAMGVQGALLFVDTLGDGLPILLLNFLDGEVYIPQGRGAVGVFGVPVIFFGTEGDVVLILRGAGEEAGVLEAGKLGKANMPSMLPVLRRACKSCRATAGEHPKV